LPPGHSPDSQSSRIDPLLSLIERFFVPDQDEDKDASDGKLAVTITASVVAIGAVALRMGGRAALISVKRLRFFTQSPELREQLQTILTTADNMALASTLLAFCAAWTAVKVLCFDAGGVI